MAAVSVRLNVRQYVVKTTNALRRSLFSRGTGSGENAPNWFGRHTGAVAINRQTSGSNIDRPQFDEPFLQLDLVAGPLDIRPPDLRFIRSLKSITLGNKIEWAWDQLPGVVQLDLAGGVRVYEDQLARDRRGTGISWVHVTARQSDERNWGNDQRLWASAPNLEYLVDGLLIRYPEFTTDGFGGVRLTPAHWSSNPAALIAWVLTNQRGVQADGIDTTSLKRAIDICNQTWTTFVRDPQAVVNEIVPFEDDDGTWHYPNDAASTSFTLPGALSSTRISAWAQHPVHRSVWVAVSSSDRCFWIIDGRDPGNPNIERVVMPTTVGRDAISGRSAYPAGGAVITRDGVLLIGVIQATSRSSATPNRWDRQDGYSYPQQDAWHLYCRRIVERGAEEPRSAINHMPTSVGGVYWSRRENQSHFYAFAADHILYMAGGYGDTDIRLFVYAWHNDNAGNDKMLTINSNHSWVRQGWIDGEAEQLKLTAYPRQGFTTIGRLAYKMGRHGALTAYQRFPLTRTGGSGHNKRWNTLSRQSSLDLAPDPVLPLASRADGYFAGFMADPSASSRFIYVRRELTDDGELQFERVLRARNTLDYEYRTVNEDEDESTGIDGFDRLTLIRHARTQELGGPVDLAYLRPRNWANLDGAGVNAPQARVYDRTVYVAREDLPANYWSNPPTSPELDLVQRNDEGVRTSGNWERVFGDRHIFAPRNLTEASLRQLRLNGRRYEAHGEIVSGEDYSRVIRSLGRAMLGHITLAGGKYYFTAGRGERWVDHGEVEVQEAVTRISDADLVGDSGGLRVQLLPPREENVNWVALEMSQDETNEWHPQVVRVGDAQALLLRGTDAPATIDMDYVTSPTQARGIGHAFLEESRHSMRVQLELSPRLAPGALDDNEKRERIEENLTHGETLYSLASLHPGDAVVCDFSRSLNGWTEREMTVEETSFDLDTGVLSMVLNERVTGHTSNFFSLPTSARDLVDKKPLRTFSSAAGRLDEFNHGDWTPTTAGRDAVVAAGNSLDGRYIYFATNEVDAEENVFERERTFPAVPAQAATPAETVATYVIQERDLGRRLFCAVNYFDSDGTTPRRNTSPLDFPIITDASSGNSLNHPSTEGIAVQGDMRVGETVTFTFDRSQLNDDIRTVGPIPESRRLSGWINSLPVPQAGETLADVWPGEFRQYIILEGARTEMQDVPAQTEASLSIDHSSPLGIYNSNIGGYFYFHAHWTSPDGTALSVTDLVRRRDNGEPALIVPESGPNTSVFQTGTEINYLGNTRDEQGGVLFSVDRDASPLMDSFTNILIDCYAVPTAVTTGGLHQRRFFFPGATRAIFGVPARTSTVVGRTIPPTIYIFDRETSAIGIMRNDFWAGYAGNGQSLGGYQADPRLTTHGGERDHYEDGFGQNTLTVPHAAGVPGALYRSSPREVTARYWFRDLEPYEAARGWLFPALAAFKTNGRNTQLLSEGTSDQRGLMCVVAWRNDASGANPRVEYSIEALSTDDMAPRGALSANRRENSTNPWVGIVRFEGTPPARDEISCVVQDREFSLWLRTDGGIEVRGSLFSWARNTLLKRYAWLDCPAGLIEPGDSIIIDQVRNSYIFDIIAIAKDGSGWYRLNNERGRWRVVPQLR